MPQIMDKRDRAALFRLRLAEAMARRSISQAALARACGVDRSTIKPQLPQPQVTVTLGAF